MTGKQFHGILIRGIASAVPSWTVSSDAFRPVYGDREVDRFIEGTGIRERRHAGKKQTASDLCCAAARALLDRYGVRDQVDVIVFATQTPDYHMPSTAFVLQERLGIQKDCLAFDVNLGCTGFVSCLYMISGMIESGMAGRALLLIGDARQEHPVTDDHSESMLYGDAGSAVLIERGEGDVRGMIRSDGSGFKTLIAPFPGARYPVTVNGEVCSSDREIMDGNEVFLFAITKVPRLFKEFLESFGLEKESFDFCILHQANRMICDKILKKIKIEKEKAPISIDRYGNTNGASIPLTICDAFGDSQEDRRLHLITCGFGIGLSYGIVSFEVSTGDILPVMISDEYYEEGFAI